MQIITITNTPSRVCVALKHQGKVFIQNFPSDTCREAIECELNAKFPCAKENTPVIAISPKVNKDAIKATKKSKAKQSPKTGKPAR